METRWNRYLGPNLASTYAADHEWTKAEGHLRRAILRDPKSVDAHIDLANVFLSQARLPAALEQLAQAAAMPPKSATVLAKSGELLILSENCQKDSPALSRR